jgi:hypothetical protein
MPGECLEHVHGPGHRGNADAGAVAERHRIGNQVSYLAPGVPPVKLVARRPRRYACRKATEIKCTSDGRSALLSAGELTVVPRSAVHGLRNAGAEPAEAILSYSSGAREFTLA